MAGMDRLVRWAWCQPERLYVVLAAQRPLPRMAFAGLGALLAGLGGLGLALGLGLVQVALALVLALMVSVAAAGVLTMGGTASLAIRVGVRYWVLLALAGLWPGLFGLSLGMAWLLRSVSEGAAIGLFLVGTGWGFGAVVRLRACGGRSYLALGLGWRRGTVVAAGLLALLALAGGLVWAEGRNLLWRLVAPSAWGLALGLLAPGAWLWDWLLVGWWRLRGGGPLGELGAQVAATWPSLRLWTVPGVAQIGAMLLAQGPAGAQGLSALAAHPADRAQLRRLLQATATPGQWLLLSRLAPAAPKALVWLGAPGGLAALAEDRPSGAWLPMLRNTPAALSRAMPELAGWLRLHGLLLQTYRWSTVRRLAQRYPRLILDGHNQAWQKLWAQIGAGAIPTQTLVEAASVGLGSADWSERLLGATAAHLAYLAAAEGG